MQTIGSSDDKKATWVRCCYISPCKYFYNSPHIKISQLQQCLGEFEQRPTRRILFYFPWPWNLHYSDQCDVFERNFVIHCLSMCQKITENSSGKGSPCTPLVPLMRESNGKMLLHLTLPFFFNSPQISNISEL